LVKLFKNYLKIKKKPAKIHMTNPCQLLPIVEAVFVYIFTQLILLGLYSFAASAPLHRSGQQ
jgi:Ni,Fe-hydrogenase I cytochrome b subunit